MAQTETKMSSNESSAAKEQVVRQCLSDAGQSHLFEGWNADTSKADIQRFCDQVLQLDSSYPGGIQTYVQNARRLLADSKAGVNPLEGWMPAVPDGAKLRFGSDAFLEHESSGLQEVGACGFVLLAGGLGERLGYSGIKVALPWQTSSGETYLGLYVRSILAMQAKARSTMGKDVRLPLAIMVSDDTAERTDRLLKENGYFGMDRSQVTCAAFIVATADV